MKEDNKNIIGLLHQLHVPHFIINQLILEINDFDKGELENVLLKYLDWLKSIKNENNISKKQVKKAIINYTNLKYEIIDQNNADLLLKNF